MATIENMKWTSCAQTSVDPDDNQNFELRASISLSKAYMYHHCHLAETSNNTRDLQEHIATLVRVGDEVEEKHRSLFKGMVKRLEICRQSKTQLREQLRRVFDEMYSDNHQNWGRIVTAYVFGACVSKSLVENHHAELADVVAEYVGETIYTRAHEWISRQGGWDTFIKFFRNRSATEETVWNGLIYTLVGLGALAYSLKNY